MRRLAVALIVLGLAACAGQPKKPDAASAPPAAQGKATAKVSPYPPAQEDPSKRGDYTAGGLYAPHIKDSAPGVDIDVSRIPEPAVVAEPRSRYGNRSTYSVLGKSYHVMDDAAGYVEEGLASYYGKKFHGRRTSNMEVYDMYAFTAAHKTLPLPSFARVTNLDNGRSVVVRVNDRGPFHKGRIIDLSYAAAVKLGITRAGTGRVEVRALLPGDAQSLRADAGKAATTVDTRTAEAAPVSGMDALVAALPEKTPAAPAAAATPVAIASTDRDPVPAGTDGVVLQVGSFTTRDNADRALATLRGAGIDGASLEDGAAGGRPVWRVRVGPLARHAVASLSSRIAGLGFGVPQPVQD
ncbi:Rare lipoprotein A precursor [Lysobacter arseniciresistens ZS79]|uniref:Endolytic peptidoglycan transglycosylase RlpA n=1 Tax=Lysobacter arseniciresistens ZS79 TaxID=913325 RepID=A0A0A0F1J9_9GAMM|nr:septal ring lytic transglycosylase RlpA family protein [Lysobacter arseniciresistens]KGM56410.1 Rare lipoprotein A precursor [Lysobacter arseniciresistens ZS79]